MEPQKDHTPPAAKPEKQKVAPKKRFTIIKLEERIAPKKYRSSDGESSGASIY
jgi:hypothetical protein